MAEERRKEDIASEVRGLESRITVEERAGANEGCSRIIITTNLMLRDGEDPMEYIRLAAGIILKSLEAAGLTSLKLSDHSVVDLTKTGRSIN